MKKIIMLLTVIIAGTAAVFAQDAEAIIHASRDRISADTVSSRSRMVITAKDGTTSERVIDQYSKDGPNGNRTVIVFQRPASVAGTRFLTMEKSSGPEDRWIFLPSLGKVRRIAASEGSGNFMGTDFSYDDISSASRKADLDTHTVLREETYGGKPCYVIESRPKNSSYQYSRMVQWIDKDTKVGYKIELYDRKNTNSPVKIVEMKDIKDVQGRLTPSVTTITTTSSGTSTSIYMDIMKYDDPIPEGVFTTAYLESGRVR
ncbi:MAG: outer membrane lipoprotein-sorting protein [Treponema sp.]|jgi:hypothetical protein|nr:outer membrane lipoprotein-sorting protein [Treponema sp.]